MNSVTKDLLEGKKYPTDLLAVILWTIIAVAGVIILPDGNIVRIILGIPLLLFIPGYCIVSALWPEEYKEKENDNQKGINPLERVVISFGLSLAIVSFLGLALNYTAAGITMTSSLVGNIIVVMISCFIAYYRRSKLQLDERFSINMHMKKLAFPADRTERVFVCAIGVALVLSCFALGYVLLTPNTDEIYTEFYLLDANGSTANYPENVTVNGTGTVIVGIVCHENREVTYTIVAGLDTSANTTDVNDWSQTFNLTNNNNYSRAISLSNGETFEDTFNFNITYIGNYKVVWRLLINGESTPYETYLWVRAISG